MLTDPFAEAIAEAEKLIETAPHIRSEQDLLEGYQYLAGGIIATTHAAWASEKTHPSFIQGTGPFTKMGLDNPDTLYFGARINDDKEYKVTGKRGTTADLSFQVLSGNYTNSNVPGSEIAFDDRELEIDDDGNFVAWFGPGPAPSLTTVKHIVVTGSSTAGLEAPEGVQVHTYEGLIADQPTEFDWPEVDELSAAAMCYTSGTTGDPKGVVYSHRSIYLHSMQVCMSDGPNLAQGDRALAVVPQFHAMSWGLPYAAFMIGASLIMPDRFLQPAPLAAIIASEKPTFAAAVPTIWQGLHLYLEQNPQ
ncbi:AMP-binding protein, partial [Streptomyces sp. NPDC002130]|uniref:AMP-binding protein n=1 Tax=Streptomyces sp. NPDC002130 TaxID=3155568 RepID=UPI0033299C8A